MAIFFYDVTSKKTFEKIPGWIEEFKTQAGGNDLIGFVIGCFRDQNALREVTGEMVTKLVDSSEEWLKGCYEVSNKNGEGVENALQDIMTVFYKEWETGEGYFEPSETTQLLARE